MATTIKEKGSGSSSSVTEKMRKNTSSPNPQAKKTATRSSDQKPEKPLPNYLKPTISSSLDFSASRTLRRSTTDISTKAIRRHPVEKPPLPAQTHKAQPAKHAPQRSVSSLSSKTGAGPSIRRSLSAKGGSGNSNGDPKKVVTKTGSKKDALEDDVALNVLETPAHDEVIEKAEEEEEEEAQHENEELGVVIEEEESIEKEGFESEADREKGMEEFKEEAEESAAKQTESGQDYNDVIEETATKLMEEDNKNKVRALAGAFETVISLQDTK